MDGDGDPDIIGAAHEDADIAWWNVTCCIGTSELVSSILDTDAGVQWDSITWNSTEPSGTLIYFQVRSSSDPMYMGSWSTDITSPGSLGNFLNNGDQYVQYKVLLETADPNFSPVLEDVTLSWFLLAPISDFSGTPTTGFAPLDVQFTDLSIQGAYPITSWIWDFGDGYNSSDQNPMHSYANPGDYTVMLTVYDGTLSDTVIKVDYISVSAEPPAADFSATPTIGYAPLDVQFTDLSLQGTYPIMIWSWYFGDGDMSSDQNPNHTYASPGDYTVMLTVSDGTLSNTLIKTEYISVSPVGSPMADFSADPLFGTVPLPVQFTDESTQGIYPIVTWNWSFGDGNASTDQNPQHTYNTKGTYTVILIVSDGTLIDTETKMDYITVYDPLFIEDIIQKEGINLYPNPFTDQITLSFDLPVEENTILKIFDLSGRMVLRQEIPEREKLIHITGLKNYPRGIYLLSIINPTLNIKRKLIH
jgi:PKD repeat protein